MGSQYIPPPEQNVVNVGDEISINALNGIAQANPAVTSTNPVATDNSVATAVSGKANLSGATFTGKIIGTPSASTAAINIGTVAATPTSPVNGDIWIGTTLSFRASDGSNRPVPVLNSGNVFNATTTTIPIIQAIQGATSSQPAVEARHLGSGPALLISQRGTGDALRVEDEVNDSSPFVINSNGKVGIGGVVPVSAEHKVAVHNGSIVFTSGYGVAFGDGSSITSATTLSSSVVQTAIDTMFSGISFMANGGNGYVFGTGESFTYESGYDMDTSTTLYTTIGGESIQVGSYSGTTTYWDGTSFVSSGQTNSYYPEGTLLTKGQYTPWSAGFPGSTTYWWATRSNGSGSYTIEQELISEPF